MAVRPIGYSGWTPRARRALVGLYLSPPVAGAVVVSVNGKSQIQALDRTQPILPLRPGIPEQQTHDYIRHGTTSLFAALQVATAGSAATCYPRQTNTEFVDFLSTVAAAHPTSTCTWSAITTPPTNIPM